jgi:hypothetical protein
MNSSIIQKIHNEIEKFDQFFKHNILSKRKRLSSPLSKRKRRKLNEENFILI